MRPGDEIPEGGEQLPPAPSCNTGEQAPVLPMPQKPQEHVEDIDGLFAHLVADDGGWRTPTTTEFDFGLGLVSGVNVAHRMPGAIARPASNHSCAYRGSLQFVSWSKRDAQSVSQAVGRCATST